MKTYPFISMFFIFLLFNEINLNAQTKDDSLSKQIRAQYKNYGLPPNLSKPGEQEIRTADGEIHFGSDVTAHNKKPDTKYINPSKASRVDPRLSKIDKERATLSKMKASTKFESVKTNSKTSKKINQHYSVQSGKSKSEQLNEKIKENLNKQKKN